MDPSQQKFLKVRSEGADETSQAGTLLVGGLVLIVGGIVLLLQAHASVAHFGGGILILTGLALAAASVWLYSRRT